MEEEIEFATKELEFAQERFKRSQEDFLAAQDEKRIAYDALVLAQQTLRDLKKQAGSTGKAVARSERNQQREAELAEKAAARAEREALREKERAEQAAAREARESRKEAELADRIAAREARKADREARDAERKADREAREKIKADDRKRKAELDAVRMQAALERQKISLAKEEDRKRKLVEREEKARVPYFKWYEVLKRCPLYAKYIPESVYFNLYVKTEEFTTVAKEMGISDYQIKNALKIYEENGKFALLSESKLFDTDVFFLFYEAHFGLKVDRTDRIYRGGKILPVEERFI